MSSVANAVVVLITASSEEEGAALSQVLVESRAAACVNMLPGVQSLYWWKGERESAREVLLIAKTRASLVPRVVELVKQHHSYTVPEVVALPVVGGNPDYLSWLAGETEEKASP